MADVLQYAHGENVSDTLSSSIGSSDLSIPVNTISKWNISGSGGTVIIDRGTSTQEIILTTGVSGSSLVVPSGGRGAYGTTAQGHNSGATIESVPTAHDWNNVITALTNVVKKSDGTLDTSKVVSAANFTDANIATSDITTNNVSTSKHGFAPKAPNDATKYLDGTGAYSTPASSSKTAIATDDNGSYSSGGTNYIYPGSLGTPNGTETNRQVAFPAGTLLQIVFNVTANTLNGNLVITVRQNAGNTTLTKTVSSGTTGVQTASSSVAVSANDLISVKIDTTAASSGSATLASFMLVYSIT